MSTPSPSMSPKDDKTSLNVVGNLTVAELLLVSKTFVLDCWAAEEFALKNGKSKKMSARSLLNGALVRIAATEQLAQITFGDRNRKGRRELELQNLKLASVHDIMDYPWPCDSVSRRVFEKALAESVKLERIKPMHVLKVATTLHRLEQAKYWSDLKQRHSSQVLAAKQRSAIEGQMADCMRSTDAPPAAELVAMVQAACEEEEPGEVSEGRRALQRHLQEVKQRQQASLAMQLPAAPAKPSSRSAGSPPDKEAGHQNKTSSVLPSVPHSMALKGSSDAGVSQRQAGRITPGSATGKVAVNSASESPDDSQAYVRKLDKPCNDTHLQSRVLGRDQQSGGRGPSASGTGQHRRRQQASDANGSTAAHAQQRPASAHTPGRPLHVGPVNGHVGVLASNPGPTVKHTPTHAASDVTKRVTPPADTLGHAPQHEPVAESPGIITSATIARLASHSAAPQPLNGLAITILGANRGNIRAMPPHTGKRKSTDMHQLRPDSSGSKGQPTSTPPSSQSASPSSPSPDQPAAAKRKKITWDPQMALSQQQAQQRPLLSSGVHFPASRHVHARQPNPAAPSNRSRLTPSLPLVPAPGSGPESVPQTQAEDQQVNRNRPRQGEVGTAGMEHPKVGVAWSWGSGAAVQGQFDAALVSMIPGVMGDQQSGDSIPPCELTFSRIMHRDETQRRQLASTACTGVYLVQCKGLWSGCSHKASDSPMTGAVYLETAGGVSGFMEHARLYGCLECSGAALALCSTSKASKHQTHGNSMAAEATAEATPEAAAASKHKQSVRQPAGLHDSRQSQQAGTVSDQPSGAPNPAFSFQTASRAEATQALAGVGLNHDLVQALVAHFTPEQLQACLENAQMVERTWEKVPGTVTPPGGTQSGVTPPSGTQSGVTPPSGTQSGVMQAGPGPTVSAVAGSSGQHPGGQAGTAPQMPARAAAAAAAEAAADDQGGSLAPEGPAAAGTCEVGPQVGVLLVSGSHVQHWLAATNMVGQLLDPVAASCAAHSHAIFAILLYSPPDPTYPPTLPPVTTPGQPPSLPQDSHPRLAAPHTVQGLSHAFPPAPRWFVPLDSIPDSLQHIIHSSLQEQPNGKVSDRDAARLAATDTSQNLPLHPDGAPPGSLATLPRPPHPAHQPSSHLARQMEPLPVPGSSRSDHQTPPQLSTPSDHPSQPPAKLQHPAAEQQQQASTSRDAVLLPAEQLSSQPAEEENLREGQLREGQLREGQLREGQLREGQLREGQLREGQLRAGQRRQGQLREGQLKEGQLREGQLKHVSELKHPRSAGEAQPQQQQQQQKQTELGSKQQLPRPEASRQCPQRHAKSPDDFASQPVPPQEPVQPASAVASSQKLGQTVLPNPSQTHPDSGLTQARDTAAKPDSHTLRQMSPVAKGGPGTGEPPNRDKLLEAEKAISEPTASQLMSVKPELAGAMPCSPPASEGGVPIRDSGESTAAEPFLPSKSAAQPFNSTATGASGLAETAAAAAAADDALQLPASAPPLAEEQAQQPFQAPAQTQLPSQAPAPAATQSMPRQKKRVYRQSSAAAAEASPAAEAPPAAKRLKHEVRVKSEPLSDKAQEEQQQQQQEHRQQQQRQSGKDATGAHPSKVREPIRHPEHPINLPPSAVDNIFRSVQKLRLQGRGQQLMSHHMDLMTHLPPLLQLRVLSKYASEVLPDGNVVRFFSLTVAAMGRRGHDIRWLTQREGTAKAYRLCDAAVSLCGRLEDCGELPARTIPTRTAQLVPLELQSAYILCVGGYRGPLSYREFAEQLMVGLLGQVYLMLQELKAVEADRKIAESNLIAAGGSPAKVHERLRQLSATRSEAQRAQHATMASEPRQLDIDSVVKGCFEGLMRLKHTPISALYDMSMNFLQSQEPLWQLRIVSVFSCNLRTTGSSPSAFLTSVCKFNRDERLNNRLVWLHHTGPPLHPQTKSAMSIAHKAGLLAKSDLKALPAKIFVLPTDLHYAAACYALGTRSSGSSPDHATAAADEFVRFAGDLIHKKADPGAVATYSRPTPKSSARSASRSASHVASQPARDDKPASGHSRHRSPAASTDAHPAPTDPHRRPPPQPPRPHTSAPQRPDSPGKHQLQRPPHQGNFPRHCKYFYRLEGGCTNRNCAYYHGSHQEYVAYMAHNRLVPYGLKFASDVGRDRWMVDAAVDGLNNMMLSQQLPRGSFSECDLRPLAFLQDPSGEHGTLQLQVVKRLAEQLPTSNPVRLLQSICQQVQAQAQTGSGGYPSMSEGYSRGPQEVFDSRGMASAPEAPFAGTASNMPPPSFGNEQMFTGPVDFTPSPVAPPLLPLPLPFAPPPLPSEDPEDGDIPFPVLRYEEELLAGMIMLQDRAGTVDSVDQLLSLQPQCSMPPELARHFQGQPTAALSSLLSRPPAPGLLNAGYPRPPPPPPPPLVKCFCLSAGDMRERVLNFLQTRPWLFKVNPHGGISVTRLAREGLIYKRDVITYLYNAFVDNASHVSLAEIDDRVAQPPGMQQVMMENNGLLGLMDTQLFRDDVMLQPGPFGPQDIRLLLRSSGV